MTTKPHDVVLRSDPPITPDPQALPCVGCRALTERVEKLERQLAELESKEIVVRASLSPAAHYWICLAAHALTVFGVCASSMFYAYATIVFLGAIGTAAVAHVFSTRSVAEKTMRTLFSSSVVAGSGLLALGMNEEAGLDGFLPALLLYVPPIVVASWFVAKLFVWVRAWRLVPPGYPSEAPKLQIRHLMISTLMIAIYLGAVRYAVGDQEEYWSIEVFAMLAYVALPVGFVTLFSCVLARIMLTARRRHIVRNAILFAFSTVIAAFFSYAGLLVIMGEGLSMDADEMVGLAIYAIVGLAAIFISPVFTFALMRSAGYRFLHP